MSNGKAHGIDGTDLIGTRTDPERIRIRFVRVREHARFWTRNRTTNGRRNGSRTHTFATKEAFERKWHRRERGRAKTPLARPKCTNEQPKRRKECDRTPIFCPERTNDQINRTTDGRTRIFENAKLFGTEQSIGTQRRRQYQEEPKMPLARPERAWRHANQRKKCDRIANILSESTNGLRDSPSKGRRRSETSKNKRLARSKWFQMGITNVQGCERPRVLTRKQLFAGILTRIRRTNIGTPPAEPTKLKLKNPLDIRWTLKKEDRHSEACSTARVC